VGLVAVALAMGLGCSVDSSTSEPIPACSSVGGTWAVAIDYGGGYVVRQSWLIVQNVCELTLTGDPPDELGPSLDATPQHGFAREGFFHAEWQKTARGCLYTTSLEPAVAGDTFQGEMLVIWRASGGDCGSGSRILLVNGKR
jgi:hypothetical protein